MGHPEPFRLEYVAVGNEDCWKPYYTGINHQGSQLRVSNDFTVPV